jgi:hypothetical protein
MHCKNRSALKINLLRRGFAWDLLKIGDNDENNTIICDCRYLAGEGSEAISVQLIIEPKP